MLISKRKIKNKLIRAGVLVPFFLKRELRLKPVREYSESNLIFLFFRYFSKHNLLIDVGAHFGESFRPYEKMGWNIFAFEPDPGNRLQITVRSDRTKLYDVAISDKDDQELILYTSPESSGISSLSPFHSSHQPTVKVATKTLATICKIENIEEVDFLKIDTEGFDFFVLKGFPFERLTPRVILCEFEDGKTSKLGYTYIDLGNFLVNQNYTVYLSEWLPIVKYGAGHTWSRIVKFPDEVLRDSKGWGNFIAIRKDCVATFETVKRAYLHSLDSNGDS